MLKTILDYNIFEKFTLNQPKPVPFGSEMENKAWLTLWEYFKSGSDICITNYKNQNSIFLTNLTTGRKGTTCQFNENCIKQHKFTFPKKQDVRSVFFIDVANDSEKNKYQMNNGYVFGFKDDYMQIWKDLALLEQPEVLPVRKNAKIKFHSWDQLSNYVLPFTDLIIVDNYMFDETIWEHNLIRIIEEFSYKTPIKFNLMLLSFSHSDSLFKIKDIHIKITKLLIDRKIQCDLSIALADQWIKEHDRGIFSNYLRVKSGDSFNFFDKNGKYITKGTDIDFHTLSKSDKINASDAALINIRDIIEKINNSLQKEKRFIENSKNRLLTIYHKVL